MSSLSSRNPSPTSAYPSYRLHTLFLFVFSFASLAFLVWCVLFTSRRLERLEVRNDRFEQVVRDVCTNYLSQVLSKLPAFAFADAYGPISDIDGPGEQLNPGVQPFSPSVVVRDNIGFSFAFSGKASLLIDGVRYSVGDFCDYGRVVEISPDRAYCLSSNSVVILRSRRASDVSGTAASKRVAAVPGDGGGAAAVEGAFF